MSVESGSASTGLPSTQLSEQDSTTADKVRVVATGAQGLMSPGFRARVLLFRPELLHYGVRVDPYTLFTQQEFEAFSHGGVRQRIALLLSARRRLVRQLSGTEGGHSVALIQRQADFLPSLGLERRASAGRRLIWDVDDAIWLDASRAAGGHRVAAFKGTTRKVRWLACRADHIVSANAYLADFLSRYSSRITIVPSVVETRAVRPRRHDDHSELVMGWIGSPTTAPYLLRITRVLARVSRELSDRSLRLLIVGGTMPSKNSFAVESVPWSVDNELDALERIDVGLMPMPDNAWTRGKSAYKALQYMSAGIPVIGDDVGVASSVIAAGKAGFVVRHEDEWVEALVTLARDSELRNRLGEYGRRRVEDGYSVKRWTPFVASIIRGEGKPTWGKP
jgi:glycosyltransferase involved in cell wall biosynthesis